MASKDLVFQKQANSKLLVSEPFTTPKGDSLRVKQLSFRKWQLTPIKKTPGDPDLTVIVTTTGPTFPGNSNGSPQVVAFWGKVWDVIKGPTELLLDALKGCNPKTVTTTKVDKDGKVTEVTTTTTCEKA